MSYTDTGFNQFLDKAEPITTSPESSEQDFETKIESISKEKISGGGKFSSVDGNMTIDFDKGFISVKDDDGVEKFRVGKNDNGKFEISILGNDGKTLFPSFEYGLFKKGTGTPDSNIATTDLIFQTMPGSELNLTLNRNSTLLVSAYILGLNLDIANTASTQAKVYFDGLQIGTVIQLGGNLSSDHLSISAEAGSMSTVVTAKAGVHNLKLLWRNTRAGGTAHIYDRSLMYVVLA